MSDDPVTDAMIEAALHARVPGGSEVWAWLPAKDAWTPHETAREVMRAALAAALRQRDEKLRVAVEALDEAQRIARLVESGIEDAQCRRTASESCAALTAHLEAALAVLQPNTGEREAKLEGLLREAADWFERNGCAGELAARIDTTLAEKVSANG